MPDSEIEIVVDDPTAPEANSPAVTTIPFHCRSDDCLDDEPDTVER
jgi:hypothetical protein